MAYDEITLRNEIANANDGDTVEISADINLSGTIAIDKSIILQSAAGGIYTIYQTAAGKHFRISPSGAGGSLTLKNIILDGMDTGGGLSAGRGGNAVMDDGSVIQNCYSSSGGGIVVGSGPNSSVIMKSGSIIQNCFAELHGGGVYVQPDSSFTMGSGSIIRGCVTNEYGGGIYVAEGSFFMNGGEISDCRSAGGGGVFLYYLDGGPPLANVKMSGGKITDCSAPYGGGVLFLNTMYVTEVNTVISGNYSSSYGGGIAILEGNVSNINTSLVTGNTAQLAEGADAEIYILADHYPQGGNAYTLMGFSASRVKAALLNGEEHELIFFKVKDNNTGEELAAFCAELAQNITDNYYLVYFLSNAILNRGQTDKIGITISTALRGVRLYGDVTGDAELALRAYVAQYVIWNIQAGYYSSTELSATVEIVRAALGNSAADCLAEIISAMRRYETRVLPSFAASTYSGATVCMLKLDGTDGKYKVTLTDSNGVLSNFTVAPDSLPQGVEVVFDYANNTMTVICSDKSVLAGGKVIIELVSVFENGDNSVYFHPLYQDLVIPDRGYEITIDAYIKPLIDEPEPTPKRPCPCYNTDCRKMIEGRKIWIDNDNAEGTRPRTVEIRLLRDGKFYKNIILDSADSDPFTFCCLPIWRNSDEEYVYQIDEEAPAGYSKKIDGYNVINTLIHTPE